ncbi:glycoside hydrolase family 24 protein [Aulographum hederae CBS 113979]|uniref:Glycoside hydrolase family 24 protein n=1 Tax=Aulographum hederae CBS 113979 TaxID=1176131 RepID=A0A6G1HDI8_9PEZI|nr:glycoside hydrolase family 24 protein [Aulographum hederae CBS 113979]
MHSSTLYAALALLPAVLAAPALEKRCTGPGVNQATLSLIESFEGYSATPYSDPSGYPTIGYGHLCSTSSCSEIPYAIPLSDADGQRLLQSDLAVAQNCITNDTGSCVVLNANQYGALVSWAFNVGCGNAASSSLISRLNTCSENTNTVISQELPKWNKSNGQVLAGLTRRRAAEVSLAQTATSAGALPACG